jgi:hypothetical protein
MKRNIKLPTFIGLAILVLGLLTGLFLINKTQILKISANVDAIPKNVRVSNITDSGLTISWTTEVQSNGFVKWGKSETSFSNVASEENSENGFVHAVNILGLNNSSNIYFKINSNTKDYDNNGIVWQSKTNQAPSSNNSNTLSSGIVLASDGTTPAKALVYITINGILVSGKTSNEGSFVIPISKYIESIDPTSVVEISVNDGVQSTAQAVIYAEYLKSIPTIILGKTYDFRSLSKGDVSTEPQSQLTIPENVLKSSRFEVYKSGVIPENNVVNIESVSEGEIINTTDPEFFGKAPKSSKIDIQVESELQTGSVTANKNGDWKWSPPNDLEPGEHKVTLKWTDTSGILRTLTRTFIVQASEGPSFESTPSATPIKTPTATTVASSAPVTTNVPSSTLPPTPETGSLTPTIGLFIMGIGVLLSSLYVWNKNNVY